MLLINKLIESLLAWSCIYFPICNFLIYPLKQSYKYSIYSIITIIAFLFHPYLGIYVNMIIYFIILFSIAILSKNPILDICFAIIGYLLIVCLNYVYILAIRPFKITVNMLENKYYILYGIILTVVFCLISKWLGNIIRPFVIKWQLSHTKPLLSKKVQFLCLFELFFCFCIFQFNIVYGQIAGHSKQIITYNALLFIAFFFITLIILCFLIRRLKIEAEMTTKLKEYEALQDYTIKVEQLYLEIRTFKHDYLNILSSMEYYIKHKEYEQLENYFENHILPQGQSLADKDSVLGKLAKLQIPEIKSLFYPKLLIAMNSQIETVIDIKDPITIINTDYVDLIRILGVFLDNAIEAAMETSEKTLYVGLITVDNTTIIRICNSCNPVENINKIYEINVSSKLGSRGIGLYNANLLIHKHSNIIHKTSCENHIFTQELQIIGGD